MSDDYDDLLPVSLHISQDGTRYLLDRHHDGLAIFGPTIELDDCKRIVALINREAR